MLVGICFGAGYICYCVAECASGKGELTLVIASREFSLK